MSTIIFGLGMALTVFGVVVIAHVGDSSVLGFAGGALLGLGYTCAYISGAESNR